jgi:ABC-type uncharacterized transport system permease subunit
LKLTIAGCGCKTRAPMALAAPLHRSQLLQGTQGIPLQFVQMIPYVLTIIAPAGVVGTSTPPAALDRAE